MKYLLWLLKAAIFFTLFAFALNNQHDATVYFFFSTFWRAPLVLVVLAAFAGGVAVGALGMLPGWWKHRSAAVANAPVSTENLPPGTSNPAAMPPIVETSAPPMTDFPPAARQNGL